MNTTKITPEAIEASFPQKKENAENNDANDSKVNLLESVGHQDHIEPANDQPEISDAQRAEEQAPASSLSVSQSAQHYQQE